MGKNRVDGIDVLNPGYSFILLVSLCICEYHECYVRFVHIASLFMFLCYILLLIFVVSSSASDCLEDHCQNNL